MKIATLVLLSVMMMAPSATLFSSPQRDKPGEVDRVGRPQSTGDQTHRRRSPRIGGGGTVGTRASRHQVRLATRPRSQAAHSGDAAISVRLSTWPISP